MLGCGQTGVTAGAIVATSDQLKALIRSHAEGDDGRFYSIAMQVAALAATRGHSKLAVEIRSLIDEAKEGGLLRPKASAVSPINQPRGELSGLFSVTYPEERLSDLVLPGATRARLDRIILEHRQKGRLAQYGLSPRRKVLFFGPPGTGKTLTSSALAGELHLPLYTILLDGLITKYMGETAAKLRLVFDYADQVRGLYLFDEFDAIGTHRTSTNDVGEMRRVLNSFLQFLERSKSDSLIVAATNNVGLLDKALFRRFDDLIEYELPSTELAVQAFKNRLAAVRHQDLDWEALADASKGLSFADISKACDEAMKAVILQEDNGEINTGLVRRMIQEQLVIER